MKVTAENLNSLLSDHGNLTLFRVQDDGNAHVARLNRTETVTYGVPCTYPEGGEHLLVADMGQMSRDTVALVHILPNNHTDHRYRVKYGEVL